MEVSEADTKTKLIRSGVELFTERGFEGISLSEILGRVSLPKGCFYHHFADKEAYVLEVIAAYDGYFQKKLSRHFQNEERAPLERLKAFVADATEGMRRHKFRRGCLVGNLGQEMGGHTEAIREALARIWKSWEEQVAELLRLAQKRKELTRKADPDEMAAAFWMGWEGAVLRAKTAGSARPLEQFAAYFFRTLPTS